MYSIVIHLYAYLCQRLSVHSSVDGHLGYFHVLTVVNNNCCEHGNTGGQMCLSPAFSSLGCIYGVEWLGHVFNF